MAERDDTLTTRDLADPGQPQAGVSRREAGPTADSDVDAAATTDATAAPATAGEQPLLDAERSGEYRRRWEEVQIGFVDEPHRCVREADELVADVMRQLAETFAEERTNLEEQWSRGDEVGTEDLRVALQRYRAFFNRLLSA